MSQRAPDAEVFTCTAGDDCESGEPDGWTGTAEEFGHRKDGNRNKRCPDCRDARARQAGHVGNVKYWGTGEETETPRDYKALRVVERWSGLNYRDTKGWSTPAAVKWQWNYRNKDGSRGLSLQELWTARMRRLAERAERCAAASKIIAARKTLGIAA